MARRFALGLLALLPWVPLTGPAAAVDPPAGGVEVTYLGNEGFLLRAGEAGVLIDALFGDGIAGYPKVPAELRAPLEAAAPPFDRVTLVLATHEHGDHFDPRAVRRFLAANPRARFVSTPQAVERLRAVPGEPLGGRARAVRPAAERPQSLETAAARLRVFSLHHGRGRATQNLGFLVELGGVRILHVGDTEVEAAEIAPLGLAAAEIDLALLPSWVLAQEELVRDGIAARRLGLMHLPARDAPADYFGRPGSLDGLVEALRAVYPELLVFVEPGTQVTLASARPGRP